MFYEITERFFLHTMNLKVFDTSVKHFQGNLPGTANDRKTLVGIFITKIRRVVCIHTCPSVYHKMQPAYEKPPTFFLLKLHDTSDGSIFPTVSSSCKTQLRERQRKTALSFCFHAAFKEPSFIAL